MKTLRTFPVLVASFLLLALSAIPLRGVVVVVNWTGQGATGSVTDPLNWDSTLTGTNDDVSFGDIMEGGSAVLLPSIASLNDVTFNGSARPAYTFDSVTSATLLTLGGDLVAETAGNDVTFTNKVTIALSGITHTADLAGDSKVIIDGIVSDASTAAAIHKINDGTLQLNGANTFSGGIDLAGGYLLLGNSSAAGTGTLTLSTGTLAPTADITLANAVSLGGSIKLGDCNTEYSITFTGNISGTGAFDVHGYGDVYFNGNNSGWTGGISFFGDNDVYANSATALGTGPVSFATYENYTYLYLNASTTINGLSGGYSSMGEGYDGSVIVLADTVALTINQATDAEYSGSIGGYSDHETSTDGGIIKTGAGTLTLSGGNDFYGNTTINQGGVIVDGTNSGYFTNSHVIVNSGGTFGVRNDGSVYSTATVNSGGKLVGDGYIQEGIISGTLSPGFNGSLSGLGAKIGTLNFEDLTLNGGGTLEFHIKYNGEGFDSDLVNVQNSATLTINATPSNQFTLKAISLNSDYMEGAALGGMIPGNTYSWLVFHTNGIYDAYSDSYGTLTPESFSIDGSMFDSGLAGGTFSLSQTGNDIYLNFTPVPEPSTYALMALGLAGTGLAAWRKRRKAA